MSSLADSIADAVQQLTQVGAPYELVEQTIGGQDYRLYKQVPASFKELLDVGRAHGDAVFIDYEGEEWTFKQFYQQADAIAYQLVNRYGIEKGDRIVIAMRNYPEWMSSFVAVVSLGAVVVPLNSWGQKEELTYGINDAQAKVVFCDQQRFDHIEDSLDSLNTKAVVVRSTKPLNNDRAETLEQFLAGADRVTAPAFDVDSEDPVMVLYTSGTTGKPKGAVSSHRNIIQAIYNFEFAATSSAMVNMETIEAMFASGNPPSSLLAVPLFHVSGLYAMFLLSLRGGRKIVMMYKWDAEKALQLIEQKKISTLSAVPTMVMDALDHPNFDKYDTSSLFALGSGGAATPARFGTLAYQKVDHVYPGTGYGMTENNATCSTGTGAAFAYKPKSAGTLSPIVDFKTCDEQGTTLPRGSTGEIWMKGPTVVQGYLNNPQANTETFVDGWLRTGDIGYIDEENFIFLVDRAKDIIIRGGENISAAEVEGCLYDHPAVAEVAAFSIPDETHGEELGVAIYCKPGKTAEPQAIQKFVAERLAAFKVPSVVHFYPEPMPRNAAGKLLKKVIREDYLA